MDMNASFECCDPLLAVAGLAEMDLSHGYNKSVVAAKKLGSATDVVECMWHVSSKSMITGSVEDSIIQVSVVDALAEPSRCIWVIMELPALEEGCKDVNGLTLPPLQKKQLPVLTAFRLRPFGACWVTVQISIAVPDAPAASMMPSFALKKLARKAARGVSKAFGKHVRTNAVLPERLTDGPRSEFYGHVQRHLDAHRQSS